MYFQGIVLDTDSRKLLIPSLAGCLKNLGYGREELDPSRNFNDRRWSPGTGRGVMLVNYLTAC